MRRLATALRNTVPPEGAVNHSNTAYEMSRMGQKALETLSGMIGFSQGGPAGAIAGREGAKVVAGVKSWLTGRALTAQPKAPGSIGLPASGAIGAIGVKEKLFPNQEE